MSGQAVAMVLNASASGVQPFFSAIGEEQERELLDELDVDRVVSAPERSRVARARDR